MVPVRARPDAAGMTTYRTDAEQLVQDFIQDLFTRGLDWQTGSVLAMFLLLVVAGLMLIFGRFVQVRSVAAD